MLSKSLILLLVLQVVVCDITEDYYEEEYLSGCGVCYEDNQCARPEELRSLLLDSDPSCLQCVTNTCDQQNFERSNDDIVSDCYSRAWIFACEFCNPVSYYNINRMESCFECRSQNCDNIPTFSFMTKASKSAVENATEAKPAEEMTQVKQTSSGKNSAEKTEKCQTSDDGNNNCDNCYTAEQCATADEVRSILIGINDNCWACANKRCSHLDSSDETALSNCWTRAWLRVCSSCKPTSFDKMLRIQRCLACLRVCDNCIGANSDIENDSFPTRIKVERSSVATIKPALKTKEEESPEANVIDCEERCIATSKCAQQEDFFTFLNSERWKCRKCIKNQCSSHFSKQNLTSSVTCYFLSRESSCKSKCERTTTAILYNFTTWRHCETCLHKCASTIHTQLSNANSGARERSSNLTQSVETTTQQVTYAVRESRLERSMGSGDLH